MYYDCIAWDFNGTILDDVHAGMGATNILLARRNLPQMDSLATYYRLFGFPIEDYYTRLGFDFSKESYDDIAAEWMVEYVRLEKAAPLRVGVRETVDRFANEGLMQVVLSASEEGLLRAQLSALGLLSSFDEVRGRDDIHGNDKTALVLAFRDRNPKRRVLFIGDTDHDAACARAAGFDCALIAGGHQSRERLLATGYPVFDSCLALADTLAAKGRV